MLDEVNARADADGADSEPFVSNSDGDEIQYHMAKDKSSSSLDTGIQISNNILRFYLRGSLSTATHSVRKKV